MNYTLKRTSSRVMAITTAVAKKHAVIDHNEDDTLIARLIEAAQDELEPPNGWLGRALSLADYECTFDEFADEIVIPASPLVSLETFTYLDTDGDEQTVSADLYTLIGTDPAKIVLDSGETWPAIQSGRPGAVKITFKAGYEPAADDENNIPLVPEIIKQYMLYQISTAYDLRHSISVGQPLHENKFIKNMLESWRVRI